MWVFTICGFFSAVEACAGAAQCVGGRKKCGHRRVIMVRARAQVDLENLLQHHGFTTSEISERIIRTAHADYPVRTLISKSVWAKFMASAAREIDYANFKSEVGASRPRRAHVYHEVWDVLREGIDDRGGLRRSSSLEGVNS